MSTDLDQLSEETVDPKAADTRTMRLKRRRNERRRRPSAAAALVLVPVLCLAGVGVSCGAGEDTANVAVAGAGDDGLCDSEDGECPQQQTDDPPAELVQVPDVIGLSASEAHTRLQAAGFTAEVAIDAIPKTGIQPDTVPGTNPMPRTPAPFGSLVALNVYVDSSLMDAEVLARVRIEQEVNAEFGDRVAGGYWDKTTATLNVRIANLSADDIDRLQSRYNDEAFTVVVSAAAIGHTDLHALNQSTQDLVHAFLPECGIQASYGIGVNVETWSVVFSLSSDAVGQSIDECISEMKEAVLANAADFAKERSIRADPADLVRFRTHPSQPLGE